MSKEYIPKFVLSNNLIKKLTDASAKESKLKNIVLPLQNKIEISYLANIDAVHFSTKLEGNQLTYKQVTDALQGKKLDVKHERDLKEVLNYSKARSLLFKEAQQSSSLTKELIFHAHSNLMKGILAGKLSGFYRESQNVIKDSDSGKIIYLPPEASDINELMESLFSWVKKSLLENLSPCITAAVFHYYFVTIHPFMDGNGKLARLFANYILLSADISLPEYASIEKQHENNKSAYYKNLRELQGYTFYDIPADIDITSWIHYWLDCLLNTYDEALIKCRGQSANGNVALLDKRLQKAVSLFNMHKRLKASEYQALTGLGRTQAVDDLNILISQQIIKRHGGGRSQVYLVM